MSQEYLTFCNAHDKGEILLFGWNRGNVHGTLQGWNMYYTHCTDIKVSFTLFLSVCHQKPELTVWLVLAVGNSDSVRSVSFSISLSFNAPLCLFLTRKMCLRRTSETQSFVCFFISLFMLSLPNFKYNSLFIYYYFIQAEHFAWL